MNVDTNRDLSRQSSFIIHYNKITAEIKSNVIKLMSFRHKKTLLLKAEGFALIGIIVSGYLSCCLRLYHNRHRLDHLRNDSVLLYLAYTSGTTPMPR